MVGSHALALSPGSLSRVREMWCSLLCFLEHSCVLRVGRMQNAEAQVTYFQKPDPASTMGDFTKPFSPVGCNRRQDTGEHLEPHLECHGPLTAQASSLLGALPKAPTVYCGKCKTRKMEQGID